MLIGAGGSVVEDQGRWVLRGAFRLVVAGVPSDPKPFSTASGAYVIREGGYFRLKETASTTEFEWPAPVRLTDNTDQRSPWLRFSTARLRQPSILPVALVSLDRLAASLVGDAPDNADDTLHYPTRTGRATRALTKQRFSMR